MKTYSELMMQFDLLKKEIEIAREHEAQRIARRVLELLAESGVDVREMAKSPPRGRKVSPKYWNPHTGATWSGRGRVPKWLVDQDLRQFLIPSPDDEQ
ncbi:H-NS histone [Burkholderia ubonensis]|uniref:H-NS histone family protein n=1 Tax=Burkholderia ubonensis TaxID=101571 RepID=UPI0007583412|nr:H-NS histone family protein [Burkholderia ubonensis]KWA80360.1 H-NS histone [Burkholderia ubonensis]KWB13925.1 H-NS histone [Burkholderia ubonensis]